MPPSLSALFSRHSYKWLAFGSFAAYSFYYLAHVRRPVHVRTPRGEFGQRVLSHWESVRARYWPFFFAWGAHFQIVLYVILANISRRLRLRRDLVRLSDGGTVSVDWDEDSKTPLPDDVPIVLILHGITGGSDDYAHTLRSIRARGWRGVAMNRRGHADTPLTTPKMNILGDADDLKQCIDYIHSRYPRAVLLCIGFSAGGCALTRYLGETGANSRLIAASAVSPAYDVRQCLKRVHPWYCRLITFRLKSVFTRLLSSEPALEAMLHAETLFDLVCSHVPITGHETLEHFLERMNPFLNFQAVQTATLMLNAKDDPVAVYENLVEAKAYADTLPYNPNIFVVSTDVGSHCAWFEHDGFRPSSWCDRVVLDFFEAVMKSVDPATATRTITL